MQFVATHTPNDGRCTHILREGGREGGKEGGREKEGEIHVHVYLWLHCHWLKGILCVGGKGRGDLHQGKCTHNTIHTTDYTLKTATSSQPRCKYLTVLS